jgi:DNA-binding transcriptional regulator YiaG
LYCNRHGGENISTIIEDSEKPLKQSYPDNPQSVGEHIRKKRIDSNKTQLEVAIISGVDEDTITGWELGRYVPQVHWYPAVITYLGYYPFDHETETIAGKLLQVRYCNGWSCKEFAKVLGVDTATVRRWELRKSVVQPKSHQKIIKLWYELI